MKWDVTLWWDTDTTHTIQNCVEVDAIPDTGYLALDTEDGIKHMVNLEHCLMWQIDDHK